MPIQYLVPHTTEWFTALEGSNLKQAQITRNIMVLTNREDCCSVCGDHPPADYKVVGRLFAPEIGATIRLCDECKVIRGAGGETFEPL